MNIDARMEQALVRAIEHLRADSGTIHLKEPGRMVLRLSASHAIPAPVLDIVREVPWGKGMAGLAAERATPVDSCNIQSDTTGNVKPGARATGVQGAMVVPMMLGNDVVGTLGVGTHAERTFTAEETRWMMEFARRLASEVAAASSESRS